MKTLLKLFPILISVVLFSCNQTTPENTEVQGSGLAVRETTENNQIKHLEWTKNANIYEVNIRQYTKEGTFNAFEKHLERLKNMGVDILWIMPINPIGKTNHKGSLGSYYSISNYTEVNPEFGSLDDFNALVDKAHNLGMHIIIDWVANHTSWDNIWTKQHPNWYEKDSLGNFISPYDWTDVISLDYENKEVWKGMQDAMLYWLENTNIDGFRCDVADLVPLEFWNETRAILDTKRPVFMLAEAETPALQEKAFDMTYAWELHHIMNEIAKQKKDATSLIDYLIKQDTTFESSDYRMIFTTNHDENSWNGTTTERLGQAKNTFAALTYFLPGMPLIYSGQEAGLNKRLKFFDKDEIDWTNLKEAELYTKLNSIKHNNSALWNGNYGGNYSIIENSTPKKVFSISRSDGHNTVYFIANLSPDSVTTTISFKNLEGEYINAISGDKVELSDKMKLSLGAWGYWVVLGR